MKHELTKEIQGEYSYVIGPYRDPVLTVKSGDTVVAHTVDAFEQKITDESVKPSSIATLPYVNPLVGPIAVEGAEPGDALAVQVISIDPVGPQPRGVTCLQKYFGLLSPTASALSEPFPEIVKMVEVTTEGIVWDEDIVFPYEPFIGTIGTAPKIEAVNSLTPSNHGGNMDLPDVAPGSTIYLPVRADGGLLYLGDVHACQGDGELCGVAIEMPARVEIKVELIKNWTLDWPRLEDENRIMSIGNSKPLEDAVKIAYNDLVHWMVDCYGFDKWDAYFILTQVGRVRIANVVDPLYTAGAWIDKRYLKKGGK
ncbi:MAG: acetamidase [Firmicutes bacterium]|jgi:acetamidase/formamidase|nr:acetamidase [Bacillota bacterium]